MATTDSKLKEKDDLSKEIEKILKAGAHISCKKSKTHPKMRIFALGTKNDIQLIDPQKIIDSLNRALDFIKKIFTKKKNAVILFVSTRPQFRSIVKELAEEIKMPYIINRWLGGTFTNFKTISKRLEYFRDLENKKLNNELKKYTKKEQMIFEKELKDLEEKMGGIKNLKGFPDIIFVIDTNKHKTAISEAKKVKIPIVAIIDLDSDPSNINYPIIANDHSIKSVKYILEKIKKTILELKK